MNRTNVLRRNLLLAGTFTFAVFNGAPVWAADITLSNSNCAGYTLSGTPPNQVLTCVTSSPPTAPGAPTGCSLSASPSSLGIGGGSVVLTASCSGGNPATSFAWNGAGTQATTTVASQTVSISASTSFSVTPSNSVGPGNTPSVFVAVQSTPPPVGAALSCPGFANTKVIDAPIPAAGSDKKYTTGSPSYAHGSFGFGPGGTSQAMNFGAQDAVIFRFVMPANESSLKINYAHTDYDGPNSVRTAVLSTDPCDFAVPSTKGLWANNISPTSGVTMHSAATGGRNSFKLNGGQTYYLNVSNFVNGQNVCANGPYGNCNLFFTFAN